MKTVAPPPAAVLTGNPGIGELVQIYMWHLQGIQCGSCIILLWYLPAVNPLFTAGPDASTSSRFFPGDVRFSNAHRYVRCLIDVDIGGAPPAWLIEDTPFLLVQAASPKRGPNKDKIAWSSCLTLHRRMSFSMRDCFVDQKIQEAVAMLSLREIRAMISNQNKDINLASQMHRLRRSPPSARQTLA
jgi:hypothetical protein